MAKKFFRAILGAALAAFMLAGPGSLKAEVLVQVLSVSDEAAARKEAARLFNLGVPAFSRAEESGEAGLRHRVYVGPFETEADAAAAAAALKKSGSVKDFVIKAGPPAAAGIEAEAPAGGEPSIPVVGGDAGGESIAGLPAAPVARPAAETPTYGEPVSPEQARDLGLTEPRGVYSGPAVASGPAGVTNLPTYGQEEAVRRPGPAGGAPPELKPGDDLPGLVPPGQAPPPPPIPVSGGATAPSAGDGSELSAAPGRQRLVSFEVVADLSSSMRRMSACRGRIKEEAATQLLRKMNHRIPAQHSYQAALRVFGYKQSLTRADFTTLYYGPAAYGREGFEGAIARLAAANAVSPFIDAFKAAEGDLQNMSSPKAALIFSDFQESEGFGQPAWEVENARRRQGLTTHTFYITRQRDGEKMAKSLAKAGGGQAWEICSLLENESAFENMMLTVFGPGGATACQDSDGDGVCDEYDICPNTPRGAPVDQRGCWIAAYSQFFDFNKHEVKGEFRPRLIEAARIIKEDVAARVIIAGYTDNIGGQDYNLALGRQRAQAVADILIAEGVPAARLSVVSHGKERPIADNSTEEGRARNRRVEFHVGEEPRAPAKGRTL